MTEQEAHRYIQKISMDSGTGMAGNRTDGYPDYAWLDKTTLMRKDVVANN